MLLPIYFTVCHRMIPFFTQHRGDGLPHGAADVDAGARPGCCCSRTCAWNCGTPTPGCGSRTLPLALLTAGLLVAWWPRERMPPLLRVLFLGFAWLPLAFALYTWQSAWFAVSGEFVLGRAPAHALFIGFFGSLLVAMVTRVTQGHSGRPLVLGGVAAHGVRDRAAGRGHAHRGGAGAGRARAGRRSPRWAGCCAFLPWVLRSGWIYLTPRRRRSVGLQASEPRMHRVLSSDQMGARRRGDRERQRCSRCAAPGVLAGAAGRCGRRCAISATPSTPCCSRRR